LTIVSPGTQTRDFTHVHDIVAGILVCADSAQGDGYQLGTGKERSLIDVAALFASPTVFIPALPGERRSGRADTSQMKALGWQPVIDLEEYVKEFCATSSFGSQAGLV
jgi:UDP-glucose 4-epimerase